MCRRRRSSQKKIINHATGESMTQAEALAAIAEAEKATKAAYAAQATALSATEDINAAKAGTIQNQETAAVNMTGLQQTVDQMGGSMEAMKNIQEQSFRQVEDAKEKERLAIKRRKEQQLQRAIRQRKQTGLTGRRSLITGTAGGKGYA